jgi:hypothetical protein
MMSEAENVKADNDGALTEGDPADTGRNPGYVEDDRLLLDNDPADAPPPVAAVERLGVDEDYAEPEALDSGREGYAVYEPSLPAKAAAQEDLPFDEVSEDEASGEWLAIGRDVVARYGDSLTGRAGYMGPVGGLLTVIGGAIIAIGAAFETSSKVISSQVLLGSAGAFIVGVFLLLFHAFHWLSNRTKARELAGLINRRMLIRTCRHLEIEISEGGEEMKLGCSHFSRELSDTPECVACPHYDTADRAREPMDSGGGGDGPRVATDDTGVEEIPAVSSKDELVSSTAWKAQAVSKSPQRDRKLLDELNAPRIGGDSGGDLDEAGNRRAFPDNGPGQGEFPWE